jgi:anhydro-N-acetylmuramic acid kinase
MSKLYYSLGLMSGTSMDGVDASVIQSDGETKYKVIIDKYFEYPQNFYKKLTKIRGKILNSRDLKKFSKKLKILENEITIFHGKISNKIIKQSKLNINFIGFHGQTIFHKANENISVQLGDGKQLSKLTKKTIIYDFRKNDLKNGGEGAPLTPIFHKLLMKQNKINLPATIINIGGIANFTVVDTHSLISNDIGPGNCLIDEWIRNNSNKKYDKEGKIASTGNIKKEFILHACDKKFLKTSSSSYDIKDFDLSLFNSLSFKDGAATITEYTAEMIKESINSISNPGVVLISGGGRKNKFLINRIKRKINKKIKLIDELGIDGDFIESQAFAYLAIRSYLNLPISFPTTTGVNKACTGGKIINN